MNKDIKMPQFEGFNENSFTTFTNEIPALNKTNIRANDPHMPPKLKLYPLSHEKLTDSVPSSLTTHEQTEKENENHSEANIKSANPSQNESFSKLRRLDNGDSFTENDLKSHPYEEPANAIPQRIKDLNEELDKIENYWEDIFRDLRKFEKSSLATLDDFIEKGQNMEKSWKMQKEMLGQRLKKMSKTFDL